MLAGSIFTQAVRDDTARPQICPASELGLVEPRAKRQGQNTYELFSVVPAQLWWPSAMWRCSRPRFASSPWPR